ncbi:MAG: glycosyltransferase [Bryobacterales bacterium]|nr:glycosyltransferase [Bryobacterales bacterium]
MRILYLSPRQCWPTHSGAKLRDFHLLRALASRATVDFAFFAEGSGISLTEEQIPGCASVNAVPRPAMYRPRHLLGGLLGQWPISVLNYTDPRMSSVALGLARSSAAERTNCLPVYDYLHLDAIHMAKYPRLLAAAGFPLRVVYDWHNIESEAMARYGQTVDSWPKRVYAGITARKLHGLERRILREAFGHVVCSQREREQLLALEPKARVEVVENGVDCGGFAEFAPSAPTEAEAGSLKLVFVGSMDYYPNIEAVVSFANNIWPRVRAKMAGAELKIVGARPVEAVQSLDGKEGITVTGTVPDVRPYYREAVASLVPLRTGGGTRLKILESMAAGVPVVSSPLGAEGLEIEDGTNILLAGPDDGERWIQHLERLRGSEEARQSLAAAGLDLVRRVYDWPILGAKLAAVYERWLLETR